MARQGNPSQCQTQPCRLTVSCQQVQTPIATPISRFVCCSLIGLALLQRPVLKRRQIAINQPPTNLSMPRTLAIITRYFGGVFYRPMQAIFSIQFIYIMRRCGRCRLCECARPEEPTQALGDYEHPQHRVWASFWLRRLVEPSNYLLVLVL